MWYNYLIYCALCAAVWVFYYLGKREGRKEKEREIGEWETYEILPDPMAFLKERQDEEYAYATIHISGFEGVFEVENVHVIPKDMTISFNYRSDNTLYTLREFEKMMYSESGERILSAKRDVIIECNGMSSTYYNAMIVEHDYEQKFVKMVVDWIG